jgi:hypothetical protein
MMVQPATTTKGPAQAGGVARGGGRENLASIQTSALVFGA